MKLTPALRFLSNQHWALSPMVFEALAGIVERHAAGDTQALGLLGDDGDKPEEPRMQVLGSVAVIPVRGVLARYADQVNGMCQRQGRSAESLQADLSRAAKDPSVRQIVLRIDSPGGTVAGTAETGDLIRAISAKGKPVVAFVDGLAASAALWLASQADEVVMSSAAAETGSLGVISAHVDVSRQSESRGAKVHIFRSVALKAPGTMGESLNADQIASIQRGLNDLHMAFASAVQAGRGLSDEQLVAVANGEVWAADRAISLGLADRIAAWDDLLIELNGGPKAVAISAPKTGALASVDVLPTPEPAHAAEGSTMSMKIAVTVLQALCAAHTADAAQIVADATAGQDEAQIKAGIETRKQARTVAEQVSALTGENNGLKAKITALEAKVAEGAIALTTANAEHDKTKKKLAEADEQLVKFVKGEPPKDVGGGDPSTAKKTITRAQFDAMDAKSRAAFFASGGDLVESK